MASLKKCISHSALNSQFKNKRLFDAIFCINLKKRTDRWIKVQMEFKKMGIKGRMIRFEAIYTPEDGRIGCAKSHLEILKLARNKKFNSILIFEDDMNCIEENVGFLKHDLVTLSGIDWDIFYLGCQFLKKGDWSFLIPKKGLLKMGGGRGTHAIAYNSSCYDQLIHEFRMIENNCEKFIRTFGAIDVYLEKILHPKLQVYMVNNVACAQSCGFSDINKKIEDYNGLIVKNFCDLKNQKIFTHLIFMFLRGPIGVIWATYRYYFVGPLKYCKGLLRENKRNN